MRRFEIALSLLLVAVLLSACGASETETDRQGNQRAGASSPPSNTAPADAPPISAAHGTGVPRQAPGAAPANSSINTPSSSIAHGTDTSATGQTGAPAANGASAGSETGVDTSKYDARITAAEAKAKRAGASKADRRAAAEALFERGYFFYGAQNPRLYKYALGDLRRVLRYQPDHGEARALIAQIETIYRQMGRPIPTNGLEP